VPLHEVRVLFRFRFERRVVEETGRGENIPTPRIEGDISGTQLVAD
jgi:hypothetical protein